uniref:Single stranded DNA binding protein 4 n=1 Tax=Pelodiscus sinensis TaxID=13735 RepID=K7FZF4_PELSI
LLQIRWEKNITLGEPPGFLHSWWCVFWDLYCAAPDRRETCEHSSEAKAFHDYSAAAAPSPVMGNMPPNDGMPGGTMPPGFFQPPPATPSAPALCPPISPLFVSSRPRAMAQPAMAGPRSAGGPCPSPGQRVFGPGLPPTGQAPHFPDSSSPLFVSSRPRAMAQPAMAGPRSAGGPCPSPGQLGAGGRVPGTPQGVQWHPGPIPAPVPGRGRSWSGKPQPAEAEGPGSSPDCSGQGPPGSGGPPGTPIMPSPGDSTNSSENMYTILSPALWGG